MLQIIFFKQGFVKGYFIQKMMVLNEINVLFVINTIKL